MPKRKRSRSYRSASSPSKSSESDRDDEGSVRAGKGDYIRDKRYKVIRTAGKGTFGTVLEVHDYKHDERIALKVVRSVKRYLEAAYVEVEILEKIRKADRDLQSLCVRLLGAFTTRIDKQKHVCIAFEKLGMSVYEFLRANKYRGFPMEHVSRIGYQIVHAVCFCHGLNLTHTDLKPENVLLKCDDYNKFDDARYGSNYRVVKDCSVRVIDFGGATFADDHHSQMINTRQYRAPEVILGLGWDEKSDIWSIGCILAELYTGELLFGTHEDIEHLALIETMLGINIPQNMIKNALERFEASEARRSRKRKKRGRSPSCVPIDKIFDGRNLRLAWPENASSPKSKELVANTMDLDDVIPVKELADFIRFCLVFDPKERPTAAELKNHELFTKHIPDLAKGLANDSSFIPEFVRGERDP